MREDGESVVVVGDLDAAPPAPEPSVTLFVEGDPRGSSGEGPQGISGSPSEAGGESSAEDPYSVDDVGPMSNTQKIVILLVIAGVIFLALYLLRYWGIF